MDVEKRKHLDIQIGAAIMENSMLVPLKKKKATNRKYHMTH